MEKEMLLRRLDDIAQSAARTQHVLAVLGLGSAGTELERMDEYSDLDIWVVVEDGYKRQYLDNLDWLTRVCPIAYRFMNSPNGYKILFEDDIFAEIDVFHLEELDKIGFSEARIIWKAAGVPESIRLPRLSHTSAARPLVELLGEALTNLYVGLGRYYRGEKLTAMRFIQVYAVDRILEMANLIEDEQPAWHDVFGNERRFERRFPGIAKELPGFTPGYEHTIEAAAAILAFLERHFEVDPAIKSAIVARLES